MKSFKWFVLVFIFLSHFRADAYSIVFVHIGENIPSYASIAFSQARYFNPDCPIYIIANQKALNDLFSQGNDDQLIGVDYEKLKKSDEHVKFNQLAKLEKGFWIYTSERFLYLYDFMREYKVKDIFHLEYDNMLYVDLAKIWPVFSSMYSGIGATFDNDKRCIPGFVYISNEKSMKSLANCFSLYGARGWNDMQVIAQFKKECPEEIEHLPIIIPEYIKNHALRSLIGHKAKNPAKYHKNIELFDSIFDAAAIGQYLGGIDVIHHGGGTPGFINESCLFNPSLLTYSWEKDDEGRLIPCVIYSGHKYRINNLHIHSKNLKNFSSTKG